MNTEAREHYSLHADAGLQRLSGYLDEVMSIVNTETACLVLHISFQAFPDSFTAITKDEFPNPKNVPSVRLDVLTVPVLSPSVTKFCARRNHKTCAMSTLSGYKVDGILVAGLHSSHLLL